MPLFESLLTWIRDSSGLISVIGALIIFFSWAVTNTLEQRYSRIKNSTETAQATFRLYTTLHEQREQLNSLAMEVIQRSDKTESDTVLYKARRRYDIERLSAHQVTELWDFIAETNSFSQSVGKPSQTSDVIAQIVKEVEPVTRKLRELDRVAEDVNNNPVPQPTELARAVQAYSDYYRREALPKVAGFYQRIVKAANQRKDEASALLASAQVQADRASHVALVLYVVGSVLALIGQAAEKTKAKESTAAAPCETAVPPKKQPVTPSGSTQP